MTPLNLPPYTAKIRKLPDGRLQILDCLRDKFVALTPEEWVRQNFVNYMIEHKGYNPILMANEVELKLNGMSRRCDTVVYNHTLSPRMIIEYKRPDVAITQKVFNQIYRYNIVLRVDYLVVSNGIQHYCCRMNYTDGSCSFLEDLPTYEELKAGDQQ